jgi:ribose/xylose/arabinose/galactoside ABC-type transport system permease subunit
VKNLTREQIVEHVLRYSTLIIFIVIFLFFALQAPRFFLPENILNIVKQASFVGIVAVGMTFVLITAGIDLSVGSNMYLSAMSAAYLLQVPALQNGWGVALALCAGLLTGIAYGALNGFAVVVLRIAPFLATLATLVAGRGLGTAITESFGLEIPPAFRAFGAASILGVPTPIIIFAIVVVGAHLVLSRTAFGRQVYAVGNDPDGARKAGIDVNRIVFSVYAICGGFAALGGVTLISLIGRLNQTFGVGKEFEVITAAVLGGTSLFGGVGVAFGAIVGSTLVQMVQAGLVFIEINLYLQTMVLAGIIFLAVFVDALRRERLAKLLRRVLRNDES